ncbi:Glutathione-regulated potassium-efflux system protein KefC [Posidoniimonas polymericola]|uniref:Glutathione-regulated potassium-efflux system protein KefC n=1 Tax=Posidoniimonas polymericola TaxID=2528002 RepID=A0A5C5XWE4_9BACT|nr:cation:proton antiporter [Posidoniimonas polymericola]TWT66861.1 Glutathione-regulated potassium-efflux system protein KefC [Posidoniimonas polymericola]
MPDHVLTDLLIIVTAGLAANIVCQRIGVSTILGYLIAGVVLGKAVLGWVADDAHEIETLSEAGVFLLLFTVGIEFSIDELKPLAWRLPVGGSVQMLLVAFPVAVFCYWAGLSAAASLLVGAALAFSSTVVVFKALGELGQSSTPHGRRAIGVLLFQDMALVPLLLVVPLLQGEAAPGWRELTELALATVAFIGAVALARIVINGYLAPALSALRSPDLMVLLAVVALGGMSLFAHRLHLPAALGAFAAGLLFGGNRWSAQVDSLVLPFRETFSAVFFISLGLLLKPDLNPMIVGPMLLALIAIKMLAATAAMWITGLRPRAALGMGLGLAHVGEFAFFLGRIAMESGVLTREEYQRMAAVALGSLLITPLLLRVGLKWTDGRGENVDEAPRTELAKPHMAVVIGVGPVGKQVASFLETRGVEVTMVDRSPVNLYPFSQLGFTTAAGDATHVDVLRAAHVPDAGMVVVCVPTDSDALQIVSTVRRLNAAANVVVRCRYQSNAEGISRAGAALVVSEERMTYERLVAELEGRLSE